MILTLHHELCLYPISLTCELVGIEGQRHQRSETAERSGERFPELHDEGMEEGVEDTNEQTCKSDC